jgi:hypothetical protein
MGWKIQIMVAVNAWILVAKSVVFVYKNMSLNFWDHSLTRNILRLNSILSTFKKS